MNWAVFLDRDGVLTDAPLVDGKALAATRAADLIVLPGAAAALDALRELGAYLFVVTNQPDVARGSLDPVELDLMHERLARELHFDAIRVCPHEGIGVCHCRKPKPGMLFDLASQWRVDLARSWMVGDRWVDIAAGAAAGTVTILVERPYSWAATSAGAPPSELAPDHRVRDVAAAATVIRRIASGRSGLP